MGSACFLIFSFLGLVFDSANKFLSLFASCESKSNGQEQRMSQQVAEWSSVVLNFD
jgi:hypothetical protein